MFWDSQKIAEDCVFHVLKVEGSITRKMWNIMENRFICDCVDCLFPPSSLHNVYSSGPSNGVLDSQLALEEQEYYKLGKRVDGA